MSSAAPPTGRRSPLLARTGTLEALTATELQAVLERTPVSARTTATPSVRAATAEILAMVARDGDDALLRLAERFDNVALQSLEVPRDRWHSALAELDGDLRRAMERAARNIATVHAAMLPQPMDVSPEPGIVITRRPDPLSRVGVYAPGGRAAYPSSLLMGAVPARVAGVGEVIVCSPPLADGLPAAAVLAAAAIAGVDRVFAVGGAGAIAAMARGTASIPRVDRIVGPGNAFVAEAKLQLVGDVAIDSPAGPSELLVLASDDADATVLAGELLAQAEHDPEAAVMAIVVGAGADALIAAVGEALGLQLEQAPRAAIAREALAQRGTLLSTTSLDAAVALANRWAPEHLLLLLPDDRSGTLLPSLRNAGTILVGASSSVAFGDYMTGANHVLPTAGLARAYSGLSTLDFFRWTTTQRVSADAAMRLRDDTRTFAMAEGLPEHAAAAMRAAGAIGT